MSEPAAYIFGYGSLINPESIARTLLEPIDRDAISPAVLENFERSWTIEEQVHLDGNLDNGVAMVFLNIKVGLGYSCNGVVFPVSEESLLNFDKRERRYDRLDVSHLVTPPQELPVYTYVGRRPYIDPPASAVVSAIYEGIVDDGLTHWGDDFRKEYEAATIPHRFQRVSEPYTFVPIST